MSEATAKAFITDAEGSTSAQDVRDAIGTIYTDLSGSSVTVGTAIGDKSGNRTTTSTTYGDLTDMSVTIAAAAGDVIALAFNATYATSGGGLLASFRASVSGTGAIDPEIARGEGSADQVGVLTLLAFHTVQAGDITGGNVTVKIQWKTNSNTLVVYNESTNNRAPVLVVTNYGQ